MAIASQLATALQALLDDPGKREQAQAALAAYKAEQERKDRYKRLAETVRD